MTHDLRGVTPGSTSAHRSTQPLCLPHMSSPSAIPAVAPLLLPVLLSFIVTELQLGGVVNLLVSPCGPKQKQELGAPDEPFTDQLPEDIKLLSLPCPLRHTDYCSLPTTIASQEKSSLLSTTVYITVLVGFHYTLCIHDHLREFCSPASRHFSANSSNL